MLNQVDDRHYQQLVRDTAETLKNLNSGQIIRAQLPQVSSLSRVKTLGMEASTHRKSERSVVYHHKNEYVGARSANKLFVQQNAPSIPYKDSAFGYEPIDDTGKLLINVGNSFKATYQDQFD